MLDLVINNHTYIGFLIFLGALTKTLGKRLSMTRQESEFFKVVVRFSRFMLLPESVRFPAPDSDLLAL